MNITLWTAADRLIGMGHLRRVEALAYGLLARGVTPRILFQGEPYLAGLLPRDRVEVRRVEGIDQALAACAEWPGTLVSDLPGLRAEHSLRLRELGCGPLIHLTDADGLHYKADVFLDGDALEKPKLARRIGGGEYNILRPSVLTHRPAIPWRARAVRRVMVCPGGADPGYCTERLLAAWHRSTRLTLVAGPAISLQRRRAWGLHLRRGDRLIYAPADLPALMLRHDLIVTLGGVTSYEAMCLGRPVAALAWRHMQPYVRGMAQAELLHDLGSVECAGKRLQALIRQQTALASRAERAFRLVDGLGAQRCVQVILDLSSSADSPLVQGNRQ